MSSKLYLVIPCYNEQECLEITNNTLQVKFDDMIKAQLISKDSKVVYVDDGSKDNTWEIISCLSKQNKHIIGLKLAHNRGHQNALLAGLMYAKDKCDACISLDADLQDDINVIDEMVKCFHEGNQVVYGVRKKREKDTFFKKHTALAFYKLMRLMGVEIVSDHADYRLLSNQALNALSEYQEVNLFLRGLVPQLGFKHTNVYYERANRVAGESKYPLKKMLAFAIEGITSFAIKPIRLITTLGLCVFLFSIFMLIYILIRHFSGYTVTGWSSLIVSIWALGGLQLLSIGIIGEYLGKVYLETKKRPRYCIETISEYEA